MPEEEKSSGDSDSPERCSLTADKPKSAVIEIRCDVRTLAAVAVGIDQLGLRPNSKSDLGATALELLKDILVHNGKTRELESTQLATEVMAKLGYGQPNRSGRGTETWAKQLEFEFQQREMNANLDDLLGRLETEEGS